MDVWIFKPIERSIYRYKNDYSLINHNAKMLLVIIIFKFFLSFALFVLFFHNVGALLLLFSNIKEKNKSLHRVLFKFLMFSFI